MTCELCFHLELFSWLVPEVRIQVQAPPAAWKHHRKIPVMAEANRTLKEPTRTSPPQRIGQKIPDLGRKAARNGSDANETRLERPGWDEPVDDGWSGPAEA